MLPLPARSKRAMVSIDFDAPTVAVLVLAERVVDVNLPASRERALLVTSCALLITTLTQKVHVQKARFGQALLMRPL